MCNISVLLYVFVLLLFLVKRHTRVRTDKKNKCLGLIDEQIVQRGMVILFFYVLFQHYLLFFFNINKK